MAKHPKDRFPWLRCGQLVLLGFVLFVSLQFVFYRPDYPLTEESLPTSGESQFLVQVIRPRVGLPLAGLLPPQLFGVDAQLKFESTAPDSIAQLLDPRRVHMGNQQFDLLVVFDERGNVTSETQVVFDMIFEDSIHRVRCYPAEGVVGKGWLRRDSNSGRFSGAFDIELEHCDDASTGESLGWPPQSLILHGFVRNVPE